MEGQPRDKIFVCIGFFHTNLVDCVACMFSLLIPDYVISRHFIVETGAVVFSMSFVCCGCNYLLGLLLSCFGHARAKNNSDSPCLA